METVCAPGSSVIYCAPFTPPGYHSALVDQFLSHTPVVVVIPVESFPHGFIGNECFTLCGEFCDLVQKDVPIGSSMSAGHSCLTHLVVVGFATCGRIRARWYA